mmetsp:Transcript_16782/g.48201  ORF Transcript_16782/g.48201 Transcript_16782/m.48201 type:complete len:326 (+) Transcript_16782:185-1162(+)
MKRQRSGNSYTGGADGFGALHNEISSKRGGSRQQTEEEGQWSEADHRDFVAAIFEVGLKHSSPSALLEHMVENEDLTVERIKSRLQKFRLKREESKAEFMSSYDDTMVRHKSDEAVSGTVPTYAGVKNQSAEPAAFLTQATIAEGSGQPLPFNPETRGNGATGAAPSVVGSSAAAASVQQYGQKVPGKSFPVAALSGSAAANTNEPGEVGGAPLRLPELTEDELNTPIGQSFNHLMGLFASLKDNLLKQRAEAAASTATGGGAAEANTGGSKEVDIVTAAAASTTVSANDDSNGIGNLHQYLPFPPRPGAPGAAAGSSNAWEPGN